MTGGLPRRATMRRMRGVARELSDARYIIHEKHDDTRRREVKRLLRQVDGPLPRHIILFDAIDGPDMMAMLMTAFQDYFHFTMPA